jgi:hypothetical protein
MEIDLHATRKWTKYDRKRPFAKLKRELAAAKSKLDKYKNIGYILSNMDPFSSRSTPSLKNITPLM